MTRVNGTIKRRLLINYRVNPAVMSRQLPAPFRPKLHDHSAIAGICLIRLEDIRPRRVPAAFGLSSENAAHRVAVIWDDEAGQHEGVYIPRRDTGSLVNHLAGGRLFPGEHHRARFHVTEDAQRIALHMRSADGAVAVDVVAHTGAQMPATSHFATVADASAFFASGGIGYSATKSGNRLDGVVLRPDSWQVEPLAVERAYSSYFEDRERFPAGSICFDCGLVMRNVQHDWEKADDLRVTGR